ncbi:MAG: GYF domain-containing protein [Bacteriovoracia bacterium]
MADNWYYVQKGNRQGPVAIEVIESLIRNQELKTEDYVWKKGFENWKKIKEVPELEVKTEAAGPDFPPAPEFPQEKELSLKDLNPDEKVIFIRVGADRGEAPTEYGPYSLNLLKKLFKENRINGKTEIFIKGTRDYKLLGDLPEYQEVFEEVPPVIQESDRRVTTRKPFIARLFIQNNKNLFEGICRDISIGGMQILIDDFKGNVGDKITINVHPENSEYHFTASGLVVRILEGNSGFSFRFQGLSDEAKRSIEKYLQEN